MNDINELITIIISLGGEASFDDIVDAYGKKYKMVIQAQHRSVIRKTLKNAPRLVVFDENRELWYLHTKDEQKEKTSSEPKTAQSGSVQFLRKVAYEWAMNKYNEGEIIGVYGDAGQRQYYVTPGIAEIVPKVSEKGSPHQSGYYCLYEVEIRPQKAVVRLMAAVTENTPTSTLDIYKEIILPSINKSYREGGRYYNKTFNSIAISRSTTEEDIVGMLEDSYKKISAYENRIINPRPYLLVCRVAYMKYYDGITDEDIPVNGGKYVSENRDGAEKNNFHRYDDGFCYVFVETKYTNGYNAENKTARSINIDQISPLCRGKDSIDRVRVVMIAFSPILNKNVVVGWYDNATVYRNRIVDAEKTYMIKCSFEDAHLIPEKERRFEVPRAQGNEYGIGQSNFWYIQNNASAKDYETKLVDYINSLKE